MPRPGVQQPGDPGEGQHQRQPAVAGAVRRPHRRVGEELLWEIDESAWLFIEPNAAQAGSGRITFAVAGLDALLERLAAQRIEHEPIETYSNGVRHVNVPDPDGNAIAFAEPPKGASASPRSAEPGSSS